MQNEVFVELLAHICTEEANHHTRRMRRCVEEGNLNAAALERGGEKTWNKGVLDAFTSRYKTLKKERNA